MEINQTTPEKAKELLEQNADAVYLDVRSIPEFIQGHPIRAINIPLLHFKPGAGGMTPNPDFQNVAQGTLAKEKMILVGCKSGGRSQKACEILSNLGYKNVLNVDGGFGGNEHQAGWKTLGLPISMENGEGVGYETLLTKTKK